MAGDWIKFEKATLDKPEVFEMAGELGIDPDAVIGKLLRVWNWFDDQSEKGNAPVTVRALLDRYSGVTGFSEAMVKVGWLVIDGNDMCLPNFERHNGQTSKTRALTAKRVAKKKSKDNAESNGDGVSQSLTEKKREEKSKSTTKEEFVEPDLNEFTDYLVNSLPKINPEWTENRSKRAASLQYETYVLSNWHDGNGKKIKNWKNKARNAFAYKKPSSFGKADKAQQILTTEGNGIHVAEL